jgi:hypothetical protein
MRRIRHPRRRAASRPRASSHASEDPAAFDDDPAAFDDDPAAFDDDPAAFHDDPAAFDPSKVRRPPATGSAASRRTTTGRGLTGIGTTTMAVGLMTWEGRQVRETSCPAGVPASSGALEIQPPGGVN